MQFSKVACFTMLLAIVSAKDEKTYNDLVKIVKDFRNTFQAFSIFIARSELFEELPVSTAFVQLLKLFSKQNVFAMITSIKDIPKHLSYNYKRMNIRYFVVIIRSISDFTDFSMVTRQSNMNLYQVLIIFTQNMQKLCLQPSGNPFHLVFDSRYLIKCQGHPIVREWYSMYPNQTMSNEILTWNSIEPGFKRLSNLTFYERRNSLHNMSLRVTTIKKDTMTGYFDQVLTEIAKLANFSISEQPCEQSPGAYDSRINEWTGIMMKLKEGKTDIGAGEFTVTEERLEIIDFSIPITVSETNFYIKESQTSHVLWSMYYKAFGLKASYYVFLIFLISPILLSLTMIKKSRASFGANMYENYFNVWGIFCAKSSPEFPDYESARILHYSLHILSFMLYAMYSALLVSYLTIFKQDMPFNSLEAFTHAKTHKILTMTNTSFTDLFKISHDTSMRELNSFLIEDKYLPTTMKDAVDQICKTNNLVLYIDQVLLRSNRYIMACELVAFARGKLSSMALAFPKNSPYVGFINYHLQRMRHVGLLNAIKNRNTKKHEFSHVTYKPVDFWSTIPLFGILYFGILLSAVILIFEMIVFYMGCRRRELARLPSLYWFVL